LSSLVLNLGSKELNLHLERLVYYLGTLLIFEHLFQLKFKFFLNAYLFSPRLCQPNITFANLISQHALFVLHYMDSGLGFQELIFSIYVQLLLDLVEPFNLHVHLKQRSLSSLLLIFTVFLEAFSFSSQFREDQLPLLNLQHFLGSFLPYILVLRLVCLSILEGTCVTIIGDNEQVCQLLLVFWNLVGLR
jgi:hypothetical protein